MSWWEERRELRSTDPSTDGLARLANVIGEAITGVERLHGGVATSAHALTTATTAYVLKRFAADDGDWVQSEWDRLVLVRDAPVPTPEPVALDRDGRWFGTPALLMRRLPGVAGYPVDAEGLGRALALLHTTPIPDPVPDVLRLPWQWEELGRSRLRTSTTPVLAHCDFHPGNVLFLDGECTGVVDWSNARIAARGLDVALLRCDLAIEPGGDAPDRVLAAYEAASGVRIEDLDVWDVIAAERAIDEGDGWVEAWTDCGVPMTPERIRSGAEAFKARAAARR
jgi:aminoglycoside phosphotransferase (APT) family kinase protein